MPTNNRKRDEILRRRFDQSGNYDVTRVGRSTYYLPRNRTPVRQSEKNQRQQPARTQQPRQTSPGFSAPSVAGRDYRKLFGVDIDPNWSAEDKIRAAGWNREKGFMDDAEYEAFVHGVQQQNELDAGLESQRLANRGQIQAERARATAQGEQDRKTLQREQELQQQLIEDSGLTPGGSDAPGASGGQGGLKPNQVWDAWSDFSENYDMRNRPTEGFQNQEDERAYRIQKLTAFQEQMGDLGLAGGSNGRGGTGTGGGGGSAQGSVQDRLEALMQGNQQGSQGQRQTNTRRSLVKPQIIRGQDGRILITNNPEDLNRQAQQEEGQRRSRGDNRKGTVAILDNNQQGQPRGTSRATTQDQDRDNQGTQQTGAQNTQDRARPERTSQSNTGNNPARDLSILGPDVGRQSSSQQRSNPPQGRQEVGFFSGGPEGMQYRRDVMQGWADQAVQGVQNAPQTIAQAPGNMAQAFAQRDVQGRRGTGRDPIGESIAASYMDATESQGQRDQVYANARRAIDQGPADQLGERVTGAFDNFGQALADSYMNAVEGQGGARNQIAQADLPNLTARVVQEAATGSQQANRAVADAVGKMTGMAEQAPEMANQLVQSLSTQAQQTGRSIQEMSTREITRLINAILGNIQEPPEMFQRTGNMRGPATWGNRQAAQPRQSPLSRNLIGVPSLREFDAS